MKIFELDDNYTVKLNKAWILQVPEFAAIYKRDKGSEGDYDGRKKLRTHKEFTYIYFFVDFTSPLQSWEPKERHKESLRYANLTDKDIDDVIQAAIKQYEVLMYEASRSLRTYKSVKKGIDAFDTYMENIDFTETDDDGKLKHSPDKFVANISRINKMYDELKLLERRIEDDLKHGGTGIRGTAVKGENEDRITNWSEDDIRTGSDGLRVDGKATVPGAGGPQSNGVTMIGMGKLIHGTAGKTKFTDEELKDTNE